MDLNMEETFLISDLDQYLEGLNLQNILDLDDSKTSGECHSAIPNVIVEDFARYLSNSVPWSDEIPCDQVENENRTISVQKEDGEEKFDSGNVLMSSARIIDPMFFKEYFSLDSPSLWQKYDSDVVKSTTLCDGLTDQLDIAETLLLEEIEKQRGHFLEIGLLIEELHRCTRSLWSQAVLEKDRVKNLVSDAQTCSTEADSIIKVKKRLHDVIRISDELQKIRHTKIVLNHFLCHAQQSDIIEAIDLLINLEDFCIQKPFKGLRIHGAILEFVKQTQQVLCDWFKNELLMRSRIDKQIKLDVLIKILPYWRDLDVGESGKASDVHAEPIHGFFEKHLNYEHSMEHLSSMKPVVESMHKISLTKASFEEFLSTIHDQAYDFLVDCWVKMLDSEVDITCNGNNKNEKDIRYFLANASSEQFVTFLDYILLGTGALIWWWDSVDKCLEDILRDLTNEDPKIISNTCPQALQGAISFWSMILKTWDSSSHFEMHSFLQIMTKTRCLSSLLCHRGERMVASLDTLINMLKKSALESIHMQSVGELNECLSNERWVYISEISTRLQNCINQLQSCYPLNFNDTLVLFESFYNSSEEKARQKDGRIVIFDEPYQVTRSVEKLIERIYHYFLFLNVASSFMPDIGHRVFQLLRIFNGTVSQLVLGAGAMQSAGLKSITIKHLAVALQCLRLVVRMTPALSACFVEPIQIVARKNISENELKQTIQDFSTHCQQIQNKIAIIMSERLQEMIATSPDSSLRSVGVEEGSKTELSLFLLKEIRTVADILKNNSIDCDYEEILVLVLEKYIDCHTILNHKLHVQRKEVAGFSDNSLLITIEGILPDLSLGDEKENWIRNRVQKIRE